MGDKKCVGTYISLIDTKNFTFRRGTEFESRDKVDTLGDKGSHHKGIGAGCSNIGNLFVKSLPVLVNESAVDANVNIIEGDNIGRGEESVHDKTDDTANSVLSEEIEGVIDADKVLDYEAMIRPR